MLRNLVAEYKRSLILVFKFFDYKTVMISFLFSLIICL